MSAYGTTPSLEIRRIFAERPALPLVGSNRTNSALVQNVEIVESPGGISPLGAPRTVHDQLESHGVGARERRRRQNLSRCRDRVAITGEDPITFKLPELRTVSDALRAISLIVEGVTTGAILIDEAQAITDIVGTFLKAVEVAEFEDRLSALEKANAGAPGSRYDA
jgi:hypothetical protein